MGINGARSLMDADPGRYCATFTWNWDSDGPPGQNQNNNDCNTLGLLVDAMSLLYHVAMKQKHIVYASPSTIHDACRIHIHRLLRVVGRRGGVHIFFDGLPPREKLPSQVDRMSKQALAGERLALGDIPDDSVRLLHHLAEWAFVEAVDRLRRRFSGILHMHRASTGEGEALINQWLIQNDGRYSRVAIISEDSDFLVYDSSPGFIPPSTLVYEEHNGRHCLQGRYYLRSKFLRAFLGQPTTLDSTIMTSVAALSGCDYCVAWEQSGVLVKMRKAMINHALGGLREKQRRRPTAAAGLTAVLRVVARYKRNGGPGWLQELCQDFSGPKVQATLDALQVVHDVYTYSLQLAANNVFDIVPGMVEVRRLLQHGIIYCYPLVETFQPAVHDEVVHAGQRDPVRHHFRSAGVHAHALIPCPPLSTQIEIWINRSSIWDFPHFRQIRTRLYSYVRLLVYKGRVPASIPPGEFWTLSPEPIVEEIIRMKSGKQSSMERTRVTVPEHTSMSSMFTESMIMLDDDLALDRALVFCLLGGAQQLPTIRKLGGDSGGVLFVASLMLPFNLACLLILMTTAPKQISDFELPRPPFEGISCSEVSRVLPLLSVACAHANFLVNTAVSFWPEKALHSYLVLPPINVSAAFRHDNAFMIWNALRSGRNLEYLASQENLVAEDSNNVSAYMSNCFQNLSTLKPNDGAWQSLLRKWHNEAVPIYNAWWDVFNLDEVDFPAPVSGTSTLQELMESADDA